MKTQQLVPNYLEVRNGQTWIGGPTHMLQKQHIPGYQGHVPGIDSENLHGKTFAKISSETLNYRNQKGFQVPSNEVYKTNYSEEFAQPFLRNAPLQNAAEQILQTMKQTKQIQEQFLIDKYQKAPKTIDDIPPIDRQPIIGYQGFRAVYRPPLKKFVPPQKPELVQSEFDKLEHDQQIKLIESNDKLRKQFQELKPPVVGYTGFQKGIYSENLYGKTFKELSVRSLQQDQK